MRSGSSNKSGTKVCRSCDREMIPAAFDKDDRTLDGLGRKCRECCRGKRICLDCDKALSIYQKRSRCYTCHRKFIQGKGIRIDHL